MFSSIVLCSLMGFVIFFFVLLLNNFSIPSVLYAAFCFYLYVSMMIAESKKKGSSVRYRRIFQVTFGILFCISFIGTLFDERGSMAITESAVNSSELPFCHIAIPQILLPLIITRNIIFPARLAGHYASASSMIYLILVIMLTVGRGWCSWICFYGGWEEGFSHVGKKKRLNLLSHNKEIREFQFGFFIFIVLVSLGQMSAVYCEWFCPFKLVTEYSPMNDVKSLIAGVMFISIFIILVVMMPILTKRRTQCSSLCPFGAFASLTDKASLFNITIDTSKCSGCLKCASSCPFGAIDIETIKNKKGHPELTCAKCGECINACPQKAIRYSFRFASKKKCSEEEIKSRIPSFLRGLTEPGNLFRFASFTCGVIMSSSFAVDTLNRLCTAVIKG